MLPPGALDLQILPDASAVARLVADRLLWELLQGCPGLTADAPSGGLRQPLGLATGRTMEPVYAALLQLVQRLPAAERQRLRAGWLSFNLDEYVGLGPDDPRSFRAFMTAALGRPLGLEPEQLQLPGGLVPDPAVEARRYAEALARAGGIGLQLLGLGLNGHVGFNEPPCGPEAPCRALMLSASTRCQNAAAFGGDPQAVPAMAISLGLAEILAARQLLLVVTGAAKATILRRCLQEPPCAAVPGSWLQQHPRLMVVADAAAAAELALP